MNNRGPTKVHIRSMSFRLTRNVDRSSWGLSLNGCSAGPRIVVQTIIVVPS